MKKKLLAELIPLLAKGMAPTAAIASGLLAPLALGSSGDLDPGFGDHGRWYSAEDFNGSARSIETLDDGSALVAGGDLDARCYYFSYDCDYFASNFVGLLDEAGEIDPSFQAASLGSIEVFDIVRQPDGKVVAVGRKVTSRGRSQTLIAFRLGQDGALDTSFNATGVFELSIADYGQMHRGLSVALEPDGRIIVGGVRVFAVDQALQSELILVRLLPAGVLDTSFGSGGVLAGLGAEYSYGMRLLSTAAGSYRIAATGTSGCAVIGVTPNGAIDGAFGSSGIARIESTPGEPLECQSIALQSDGAILVAGNSAGKGFAARLLANGAPDPAFVADPDFAAATYDATALAATADGKILIAGVGVGGATIMRLQATGELDSLFGQDGLTWIDLPTEFGSYPVVHDVKVDTDGNIIAAGGDDQWYVQHPFVVRLLGADGSDGAGILSVSRAYVDAVEQDGQAVVHVRRSGGSSGSVSIDYQTVLSDGSAVEGEDYSPVSGQLTWVDGDASEREIIVPIEEDAGPAESYESFRVKLSGVQGGAGIGTQNATITILPDGSPAGQISLINLPQDVGESGVAQVWVSRDYYCSGAISATLTPVGESATAGEDFDPEPVVLSWNDGECDSRYVEIPIPDDTAREGRETFALELSAPTGGAILGAVSSGEIAIEESDQPRPPAPGAGRNGGGGAAEFLALLLLGLAEFFRSARRPLHRHT
jgi:uncharacterized delta-60 repeat protein